MWELMKIVFPMRLSSRRMSISSIRARGSSPLAGSSSSNRLRVVHQDPRQAHPLLHARATGP